MRAKKSMKLFFLGIIFVFHTLSANADSTFLSPINMTGQTQCCYGDISQVNMSAGISSTGYPPNNNTIITNQNTSSGVDCTFSGRLVTTCTATNCTIMECAAPFVDVIGNPLRHIRCCMVAGGVCPATPTC